MTCPICQSSVSKILTDKLRGRKRGKVLYCPRCELGMLDTHESENTLREYYDKQYRKSHSPSLKKILSPQQIFQIESPLQRYRLKLIKKHLKKNMRVLDIGCSAGMFLKDVKPYVAKIYGIDYDSKSARFACQKTGAKTYTEDIDQTDIPLKSLDMVSMFHTLEHVKNPYEFLKKVIPYLKPSGMLFIEVPNLQDALLKAYDLRNYYENHWFHEAHLWYFTPKSLEKLMKKLGLASQLFFYQDYNFINHMNWIINDQPQSTAVLGRSAPSLPFRADLDQSKKIALKKFVSRTDKEYKQLLEKLGLAANMLLIGKKENKA